MKKQSQRKQQQEKQMIQICMEGVPMQKMLALRLKQLKNLRTLKKKLLNQFGYEQSQVKNIQIILMKIYPNQPENLKTPIFNQQNLKLIVNFLNAYDRKIKVQGTLLVQEEAMKKKQILSQQAIEKGQIHFDENGSVIEQNDQMGRNIPNNEKFDCANGHVRCQFCQKNNQDIKYVKKCGGFYGPFGQNKYTHLLCALWCHRVFLDDDDGMLKNVGEEINRAKQKKCFHCKQKGAGLICVAQRVTKKNRKVKCTRSYHFKCAFDFGCRLNWLTFKMLCQKCGKDENNWEYLQNQNERQDDMIRPENYSDEQNFYENDHHMREMNQQNNEMSQKTISMKNKIQIKFQDDR